jgi:hypothetical protein
VNVAVLLLEGFGLNVTAAGPDHVYVRVPPSGSVAAALTFTVVPVTVVVDADAGDVTVGGWFAVTVTLAVPFTDPELAVTVNGPPAVVALKSPVVLIVPPPDTDQPTVAVIAFPN